MRFPGSATGVHWSTSTGHVHSRHTTIGWILFMKRHLNYHLLVTVSHWLFVLEWLTRFASRYNAGHAIANGTRFVLYTTSENDIIDRISFQTETGLRVIISLHEALYDGDVVVKDGKALVQFVGMSACSLRNKPGLMWLELHQAF